MHVFVTGATGWVGCEVVKDLIGAGYLVTGLARSDDKAQALAATGAKVLRGSLDDLDVLRRAAWRAARSRVTCPTPAPHANPNPPRACWLNVAYGRQPCDWRRRCTGWATMVFCRF